MKLLTKEIIAQFAKQGPACDPLTGETRIADPKVIAKFFDPCGSFSWYASEFTPEDGVFFGFVVSSLCPEGELGYFSLEELESYRGRFGLGIERDLHFAPRPLSEVRAKIDAGVHV